MLLTCFNNKYYQSTWQQPVWGHNRFEDISFCTEKQPKYKKTKLWDAVTRLNGVQSRSSLVQCPCMDNEEKDTFTFIVSVHWFGYLQRLSKSCQILDSLVVQLIGCHELNRTVSVQANQVIKVTHNGRLWGGRNILFIILIKSSPEIPRFVNIKIQVEVEVEVDCELGDCFFGLYPPKVDNSLQLL